ncbi:hypothetical protein [Methylobacterium ajmalii]|uniref:hypothetical protein n=1 Tax=Methylobacterium ajmalii TaxID=2738439 RepID=UPI002F3526DA
MNGMIIYRGTSVIDGKPIVVIATGLQTGGNNSKTGAMVQVYILRSDIDPWAAVHTGEDASICGGCKHRGRIVPSDRPGFETRNVERSCYVVLMHGPRMVYNAFRNNAYPEVPLSVARQKLRGLKVRVGAYGDPGAVPMAVWDEALDRADLVNSYTHLWRERPELSAFCMASCDTEEEREAAKALGFRTFRVRPKDAAKLSGEGLCPASAEMSKAVRCASCMLCGGRRTGARADITIQVHGTGAGHFTRAAALA